LINFIFVLNFIYLLKFLQFASRCIKCIFIINVLEISSCDKVITSHKRSLGFNKLLQKKVKMKSWYFSFSQFYSSKGVTITTIWTHKSISNKNNILKTCFKKLQLSYWSISFWNVMILRILPFKLYLLNCILEINWL
jgi:hypothetical protein